MEDNMSVLASASAGLVTRPGVCEASQIKGVYVAQCVGADGGVKWFDRIDNLVTTVGKNDLLDKYLSGSSWTTGTVYMGLKGAGTAAAGDTMSSHGGWSELNISSSSGARQSVSFSSASSGSKATSSAVSWSITSSGTVAGCFIAVGTTSTNANTTGVLFSAGDFSGGNRAVVNGDTINITYTASV